MVLSRTTRACYTPLQSCLTEYFLAKSKFASESCQNMYGLWAKREIKLAGYWPSSFFACSWTETKSRSINMQKKRTRPISSHLNQTSWVNKGFIIRKKCAIFLRDTTGSPEPARSRHPACSGSRSQHRIWFILPAHGAIC